MLGRGRELAVPARDLPRRQGLKLLPGRITCIMDTIWKAPDPAGTAERSGWAQSNNRVLSRWTMLQREGTPVP